MIDTRQPGDETRWVCHCSHPPVLLAIYDRMGRIEIKVGDRYYIARGRIQAVCPKCGSWHTLEVRNTALAPDPPRQTRDRLSPDSGGEEW